MGERHYSKQASADKGPHEHPVPESCLDLRGIKCPLNWARAKVHLETLARGAELQLILDDPKGVRDIPRAAEAEGYAVVAVEPHADAWRIVIHV